MSKITRLLASCALTVAAGSAFAQNDSQDHEKHHPQSASTEAPAKNESKHSKVDGMDMMSMPMMKEHMQKMRAHMKKMHDAKSSSAREAMMSDQMEMMMDHMNMMMNMMGSKDHGK
jgi:hypothetical protein